MQTKELSEKKNFGIIPYLKLKLAVFFMLIHQSPATLNTYTDYALSIQKNYIVFKIADERKGTLIDSRTFFRNQGALEVHLCPQDFGMNKEKPFQKKPL